ncbi:hypothetical protein IMSAGC019_02598 [Lachnospiraceae bacterium]|nr:hypothetical protein IMSAGC019_02598 [Lachnospiraceae bacterium]
MVLLFVENGCLSAAKSTLNIQPSGNFLDSSITGKEAQERAIQYSDRHKTGKEVIMAVWQCGAWKEWKGYIRQEQKEWKKK